MKIALCQLNTAMGNVEANTHRVVEELQAAKAAGAELAVFPELTLAGYLPKDLLEYDSFVEKCLGALAPVQDACSAIGIDAIVGVLHRNIFGGKKALLNAAAFVSRDRETSFTFKKLLPNYDVFDERRYFEPCPAAHVPPIIEYPDDGTGQPLRIGISICEDIWNDNEFWKDERLYEFDPINTLAEAGANCIVNISASPFVVKKPPRRLEMLRHTARRWNLPVILVNQVGGNDQVIFDGGSTVILPDGSMPVCAGWFRETTAIWDTTDRATRPDAREIVNNLEDDAATIHDALVMGLRDYLRKTGFQQVVVGNSGGIDSAVVLTLAVQALGPENVISVSMPGPFSSTGTRGDSDEVARRLGIRHMIVPIVAPFDEMQRLLASAGSATVDTLFGGDVSQVHRLAGENLQARLRGNILMWISNAIASPRTMVLSTGNKSEQAAGYCTLYGDMAGGLSLIADVPKMMVYRLARYLNTCMNNPIPQSVIDREPTAELAPNQRDSDSLPPYPVLDEIVRLYVEERKGAEEIAQANVASIDLVQRVIRMIDNAEYKRAQAAPGLKVTSKAFGFGRRMPIARGK